MSIESWLNRSAARSRLRELEHHLQQLQQEKSVLLAAISYAHGGVLPASASPATERPIARQTPPRDGFAGLASRRGETLTTLLANRMAEGPAGKGWTIGDLVEALGRTHPERVQARNASSLISAALAQALRAKQPLFVSRKRRGKRSHLYRLAKPK